MVACSGAGACESHAKSGLCCGMPEEAQELDMPMSPRDEELPNYRMWYRESRNDGGRRQIGLFDTRSGLFACFRAILSPVSKS